MRTFWKRGATLLAAILVLFSMISAQTTVIRNAFIIDGSGRPGFRGDVRLNGAMITKVGKIKPKKGETVIDAGGMVLAPGFIDIHNHSEDGLLTEGIAANQISQGITTILVGPDGGSPFPLAEYFARLDGKIAPNVGAFIGHATLREQVMNGDYKRQTTPDELARMVALTEQSMKEGAFGLSSGLEYDIGFSASTEEMIAISKVAARYGGIYMTHVRDEEEGVLDAIRESVRIGREAKLPVQISHIKMGNKLVWNKSTEAIALIEAERKAGFDVTADVYPYTAWHSTITVLVPSRRFDDVEAVEKGLANVGGADKVLIATCRAHREYEGKTLDVLARENNLTPAAMFMKIVKDGGASVVCNSMTEDDVKNFFQQPWAMVSSDGGIGGRHPRGTGTFPRVLGQFVRENKWLGLEEAIRKMSDFPARRLGLRDRGMIKKGMKADLVLFDRDKVIDRATFMKPELFADGILTVFVNGRTVWQNGKPTGELPGAILKKN